MLDRILLCSFGIIGMYMNIKSISLVNGENSTTYVCEDEAVECDSDLDVRITWAHLYTEHYVGVQFSSIIRDWNELNNYCLEEFGTTLATWTTKEEQALVAAARVDPRRAAWVGANSSDTEGNKTYYFLDGTELTSENTVYSRTPFDDSQNCVQIDGNDVCEEDYGAFSYNCDITWSHFICNAPEEYNPYFGKEPLPWSYFWGEPHCSVTLYTTNDWGLSGGQSYGPYNETGAYSTEDDDFTCQFPRDSILSFVVDVKENWQCAVELGTSGAFMEYYFDQNQTVFVNGESCYDDQFAQLESFYTWNCSSSKVSSLSVESRLVYVEPTKQPTVLPTEAPGQDSLANLNTFGNIIVLFVSFVVCIIV